MAQEEEKMTAQIIYMPVPRELTPQQIDHWENQLEAAERAVEVAK